MLYPSIDKLLDIVDSKYSLVVAASKRARSLRDGAKSDLKGQKLISMLVLRLKSFTATTLAMRKSSRLRTRKRNKSLTQQPFVVVIFSQNSR